MSVVHADAVCLACGCLCDDIAVTVGSGRVEATGRACTIGASWFRRGGIEDDRPEATLDGRACNASEALDRAAELLRHARSPLVSGLSWTTIEAQRAAVALADRLGATIDPIGVNPQLASAFQRVGRLTATLGEVRDRADVVIFWGGDPATTHPRHFERYSVDPPGRFVPRGRADRRIVAVSTGQATAARADRTIAVAPHDWMGVLRALRARIRGLDLPADRAAGVPAAEIAALADLLKAARYGVLFHEAHFGSGRDGAALAEEASRLIRDLNATTRFVALSLGEPGNPAGAEAVLGWQAGAGSAVDFARGVPCYRPDEATAEARLANAEADAAVIVGADPAPALSAPATAHLGRIPRIVIAPDATDPARGASVGLASATTGLQVAGTVARVDGVFLPLRPIFPTTRRTDRAWLAALLDRLDGRGDAR